MPSDAGKVLDASVLPSSDDGEDGAWVVLTEKAGIWAIPEKAVVLGGVEPPLYCSLQFVYFHLLPVPLR